MTPRRRARPRRTPDTVWTERVRWIDRVPRCGVDARRLPGLHRASGSSSPASGWSRRSSCRPRRRPSGTSSSSARTCSPAATCWPALWITTQEVLYGFALAIAIGFTLGVLVGETAFGERAVMPYLVAIDTMPKVAFAPLFVAWLGFGIASKVALAAFIATFPIVVGTAAGLHAADDNARMLFKTMGASRWQTLWSAQAARPACRTSSPG